MIAATKATLVAAVFMHLNHERRMIYILIGLGAIHATGLFLGTYMHYADLTNDRYFYGGDRVPNPTHNLPEQSTTAIDSEASVR